MLSDRYAAAQRSLISRLALLSSSGWQRQAGFNPLEPEGPRMAKLSVFYLPTVKVGDLEETPFAIVLSDADTIVSPGTS